MADAHLTEHLSVGRALDTVVILAAGESIPHGFYISGNSRCGPVRVAIVRHYAAQMLKLVVLVFHRAFQPVLAVEIHHDATLVKTVMAACKISLHHEAEILFAGLHLQYGRIVVLEVILS